MLEYVTQIIAWHTYFYSLFIVHVWHQVNLSLNDHVNSQIIFALIVSLWAILCINILHSFRIYNAQISRWVLLQIPIWHHHTCLCCRCDAQLLLLNVLSACEQRAKINFQDDIAAYNYLHCEQHFTCIYMLTYSFYLIFTNSIYASIL